jgi:tRNA modification GTPase
VLDPSETIVAIASQPGPAARGLVRLSGPLAVSITLEDFDGDGPTPSPFRPIGYTGRIALSQPSASLPATLVLWPGPRSYTGQPVAEVHTIGSPPLLRHLVALYLARGARLAEPGEFTLRAFLSGRIDLAQSEAVLRVIEARTTGQLDSALRQLAGGLAGPLRALRDRLLDRLVELEANLDFVDEPDVSPIHRRALVDDLADASRTLESLIAGLRSRDVADARPRVVLVGRPNAGKSRLFNALLGDDRAIVSPVAGTTRDYLVGVCECDGMAVELIDTAGEELALHAIGVSSQDQRSRQVAEADLLLRCVPADEPELEVPADRLSLLVRTKADKSAVRSQPGFATSALTGQGLDELRAAIAAELRSRPVQADATHQLGSLWRESLDRGAESLRHALAVATGPGGEELIAAELRQAVDDLGKIVGTVVTEDILDRIFRRFCIGK